MRPQLSDFFSVTSDREKDDSSNFRKNLKNYLYHWPLFVLFLGVLLTLALLYSRTLAPVYEVDATILTADQTKAPEEKSTLQQLDVSTAPKLAESEIEVLKSRKLINQVVRDLKLNISYQTKEGLKTVDLYKNSPVVLKLMDSAKITETQIIKVLIKDNKSFLIKYPNKKAQTFFFNQLLSNRFGKWQLLPGTDLQSSIGKEITISIDDPDKAAEGFQKSVEAVLLNKVAPAIGLSIMETVPDRGKDVLNGIISHYIQNNLAEKNRLIQNTLDFLDRRIVSISNDLNGSEKALANFRSDKGLADISTQSQLYLQSVQSNDNNINEINVELNIVENIEKLIKTSDNLQGAAAALGSKYPTLNSLIENLAQLQAQKDKLLAISPETNPAFDPINRQIATTKSNIKENIHNIKLSLVAAKSKLAAFDSGLQSSIKDIPGQERQLVDKTRQKSIKENLYTYLLQKREEVSMRYVADVADTQVVDRAYVNAPKSQKAMIFGAALFLGLFLPALLIYVRDTYNSRIVSGTDIEKVTGLPLFAELAYARSKSKLIIADNNNIPLAEEFRALRTNLNFLKKTEAGAVFLVTSSIDKEGKSFIATNIGQTLAVSGKSTVILEADLRKPKVLDVFNLPATRPGISNFLAGEATKEAIIQNSGVNPKLDIVGSGYIPPDPSEILSSEALDSLIQWLRSKYDFIIIDSPPVNLVTDAKILSRLADSTIYIIRQGYTYKALLSFIKTLVQEKRFPDMQFVLNGIEKVKYGSYYGNEYYRAIGTEHKKNKLKLAFAGFSKRF